MEKITLRRIGWVGASLGLTSVLVGCNDVNSDAGQNVAGGGSETQGYLDSTNGLSAINGLSAVNGLSSANGLSAVNGLSSANGLSSVNGFSAVNGLSGANGFSAANGLSAVNGMNSANGLSSVNGLSSANGLMTTDGGRKTISYLVRCALAAGDSLVKADQNGVNYTFAGGIGLAPQYKTGGCAKDCLEELSSCLMAHINTAGVHIPLWLTSPDSAIGWGQSPSYPNREGTFFGQLMLLNAANNLDAYYCNGPGEDSSVVPGRLGSLQGSVPYANAYPTTGGDCNSHCSMQSSGDGAVSCPGNGVTWKHPVTVWRGQTFQAEDAQMIGQSATQYCTPTTNCGGGKRVSWINNPTSGIKLTGVNVSAAGTNSLVVYYTDGDSYYGRSLSVSVNGGTPQIVNFAYAGGTWDQVTSMTMTLSGFNAGNNNTVQLMGANGNGAPDIDWIEVVNNSGSVGPNYCDISKWVASASNFTTALPQAALDGNVTTRFSTNRPQDGTDWFQVNFPGMVKMSTITLNGGGAFDDALDFPGGYALYGSTDGTTFSSTPFATGSGTANQTVITFAQQSLKAIKVKQTGTTNSARWWSIDEFQTNCTQ
jgi:F5/8 type C domain